MIRNAQGAVRLPGVNRIIRPVKYMFIAQNVSTVTYGEKRMKTIDAFKIQKVRQKQCERLTDQNRFPEYRSDKQAFLDGFDVGVLAVLSAFNIDLGCPRYEIPGRVLNGLFCTHCKHYGKQGGCPGMV
jgi:hypothetical protein